MGKRKTDDFIVSDREQDESVKSTSDESEESVEHAEVKPKSLKVRLTLGAGNRVFKIHTPVQNKGKVAAKQDDGDEEQSKDSKISKTQTPKSVKVRPCSCP